MIHPEIESVLNGKSDGAILCADCLDVLREMPEGCVDLVCTDPPYGINWKRGTNHARHSKAHMGIAGDKDTSYRDMMLAMMPNTPAIVFGSFYAPFPDRVRQVCVWHKPDDAGVVGATSGFRRDAEPIFLLDPWPKRTVRYSSVFRSLRGQGATAKDTGHPHTKPLDLMIQLLLRIDAKIILDPFCGSGTTCVAAKMLGRRYIGIDISPEYCEIARKRLESVNTGVPVRERDNGQLPLFGEPTP